MAESVSRLTAPQIFAQQKPRVQSAKPTAKYRRNQMMQRAQQTTANLNNPQVMSRLTTFSPVIGVGTYAFEQRGLLNPSIGAQSEAQTGIFPVKPLMGGMMINQDRLRSMAAATMSPEHRLGNRTRK